MLQKLKIIGPKRLTKYEKARIIGARALQISLGAPILIKVPKGVYDPIEIATLELKHKILPLIVRRRLPNDKYQDIPIKYLEV